MARRFGLWILIGILFSLTGCSQTAAEIEALPSEMAVSHARLAQALTKDLAAAQKEYDGKVITVSGQIFAVQWDSRGDYEYFVQLAQMELEDDDRYYENFKAMQPLIVQGICYFRKEQEPQLLRLQAGRQIRIKGKIHIKNKLMYTMTGCVLP